MKLSILLLLLLTTTTIHAEITLDGTLGPSLFLTGPDYAINAELGQQQGNNLFHSFENFNLSANESATFSGTNTIQNVISRVTGGNPSNIDGLIRSTIPNADMYFLNPYGIMFGPNAKLDVQGSFHASTADYLRLGENGQFNARLPNDSLLTVAPVEAFGFLGNSPQSLSIEGSQFTTSPGKTLSFIGGNIQITEALLTAISGRIHLASMNNPGEVIPVSQDLVLSSNAGNMTLQNSEITLSEGGHTGGIYIRAGQFVMENTLVTSTTSSTISAGDINVQANSMMILNDGQLISQTAGDGQGANIKIQVIDLAIEGASINAQTFGNGQGGNINIQATENMRLYGFRSNDLGSSIITLARGTGENAGRGGTINLTTKQLELTDGAQMTTGTLGTGQGGDANIKVTENIQLSGQDQRNSTSSRILTTTFGSGNGGVLVLEANQLNLIDGTFISADSRNTGQGGNIIINVNGLVKLEGVNSEGIGSIIAANSEGEMDNAGNAGTIELKAGHLQVLDGGQIGSSTFGPGQGGKVDIEVSKEAIFSGKNQNGFFSGIVTTSEEDATGDAGTIVLYANQLRLNNAQINASTKNTGLGGNIDIQATRINLSNKGVITVDSKGKGNAGQITLTTDQLIIRDKASGIETFAFNAGGGNITISSPNLVYLQEGQITTSVKGGAGDGGNITIQNPVFVVLNGGQIKAQADVGKGGDIRILSDQFIASNESLVSASSQRNIDGQIVITAPDEIVTEDLLVLSTDFQDMSNLLSKTVCSHQTDDTSRLVVRPYTGRRTSPSDWKASHLLPNASQKITDNNAKSQPTNSRLKSQVPIKPIILLAECQPRSESVPVQMSMEEKTTDWFPEQLF
jgi:filamentous hemagglutinin family protein